MLRGGFNVVEEVGEVGGRLEIDFAVVGVHVKAVAGGMLWGFCAHEAVFCREHKIKINEESQDESRDSAINVKKLFIFWLKGLDSNSDFLPHRRVLSVSPPFITRTSQKVVLEGLADCLFRQ